MVSHLLARLSSEHGEILAALRNLLRPGHSTGGARSVLFKTLDEALRSHFDTETGKLVGPLRASVCTHARALASEHTSEIARLKQLLLRAGALAWSRRRALQALAELRVALERQFAQEESRLYNEARRHLNAPDASPCGGLDGLTLETSHGA